MLAAFLASAILAFGVQGAATAAAQPLDELHATLSSILDASDLGPTERKAVEDRFDVLAREAVSRVGGVRSPERRARQLHRWLSHRVFVRYQDDADGIADVLARGNFNCVSSTLLEGLLATSVGLKAAIVSGPHHVVLRVTLPERVVDIETTDRDGFDAGNRAAASVRFRLAGTPGEFDDMEIRGTGPIEARASSGAVVEIRNGAAFVWHNAAERELARGDGLTAARHLLTAQTLYPGIAAGAESVQTQLGRAFHQEYDAGRFDQAFEIASIGVRLGPSVVSAHDRLVAAAAQRMERLLDGGDVAGAERIFGEVRDLLGPHSVRFERHMLPSMVAAAVRIGDWDCAEAFAGRFGEVELDPVEIRRLRAWIDGRRLDAGLGRP